MNHHRLHLGAPAVALAATATLFVVLLLSAVPAQALQSSYCARSVGQPDHCLQSTTTAHTWNYNRAQTSPASANLCAYISSNQNGNGAIYGSGCAPGTYYNFCHAPVVNYYWAFVSHVGDSGNRTIYGYAQTDKDCSSLRTGAPSASTPGSSANLRATNAAFREKPAATLPASVLALAQTENESEKSANVNVDDARAVGPDSSVYALPATAGTCAALTIAKGTSTVLTCTDQSRDGIPMAVTVTDLGHTAWGVVPDGVTAVDVTLPDGTTSRVKTVNNGFRASFAERPVGLKAVR